MGTAWDDDDDDPKAARQKPPPPPPGATRAESPRAERESPMERRPAPPRLPDHETLDAEPVAEPPRPSRTLPWLLAALATTGLAAMVTRNLHRDARARDELAKARDEAAEFRAQRFRAEDELHRAEEARAKESAAATKLEAAAIERDKNARLISELKAQLDAKDGEVSGDRNEIAVNLVDQILFKSGDADLSPRGKEVLARVGAVLKKVTDKQILIGGHTDSRPIHTAQFPSNWELSSARAVNVVRYLAESAGVDPARLTAAGYSQFHPRGRSLAQNRRIEILLTPMVTVKKSG